jgi:LysM repeat protein
MEVSMLGTKKKCSSKIYFFVVNTVMVALSVANLSLPAHAANSYKVQPGDSLSTIAEKNKVSINQLVSINNLKNAHDIRVGDIILISDITARNYKVKSQLHTVQPGDSFTSIAKQYKTSVAVIAELNNFEVTKNQLYVGDKIAVPFTSVTTPPASKPTATNITRSGNRPSLPKVTVMSYTVKKSDTLTRLAYRYNTTTSDLARINQLRPTAKLLIGQKLLVPVQKL